MRPPPAATGEAQDAILSAAATAAAAFGRNAHCEAQCGSPSGVAYSSSLSPSLTTILHSSFSLSTLHSYSPGSVHPTCITSGFARGGPSSDLLPNARHIASGSVACMTPKHLQSDNVSANVKDKAVMTETVKKCNKAVCKDAALSNVACARGGSRGLQTTAEGCV